MLERYQLKLLLLNVISSVRPALFLFQVPWSRLGQEPVLVYLDRIFVLAETATQVEGCSEDAIQEAKKIRVRVSSWDNVSLSIYLML